MANKKEYAPRRTTAIGFLQFPHVLKADSKFNPEKPRYKAPISLTSDEAKPVIDAILADTKFGMPAAEALRDAAIAASKGKKLPPKKDPANADQVVPYQDVLDENGEPTGRVLLKIGGNDRFKNKKGETVMLTVKLFDSKGNELVGAKRPKEVWGGTRARVSYSHFPYYNAATNEYGVSLRLEAVKIIELKAGGSAGAEAFGFGDEEEGYEADEMATDESGTTSSEPAGELPTDADF